MAPATAPAAMADPSSRPASAPPATARPRKARKISHAITTWVKTRRQPQGWSRMLGPVGRHLATFSGGAFGRARGGRVTRDVDVARAERLCLPRGGVVGVAPHAAGVVRQEVDR